jgi:hypothetical protein
MTTKKTAAAVVVRPSVTLFFKHTELIPVPGTDYQDVRIVYKYEVDGVKYKEQTSTSRGSQMTAQANAVLAQLRYIQATFPEANVILQTDDEYLTSNVRHFVFNDPRTRITRPETIARIKPIMDRIGEVIDTFNSFEVDEQEMPVEFRPRNLFTLNGLGEPEVEIKVPQPKVDRRFTSGEAATAKPKAKPVAKPKAAPVGPTPIPEQGDLFPAEEQRKAA